MMTGDELTQASTADMTVKTTNNEFQAVSSF